MSVTHYTCKYVHFLKLTHGNNLEKSWFFKVHVALVGFKNTSIFLYYCESQCDFICRNGNFQDSVRCLRGLHSSCQDPVKLEMLKKYADPNAWEAGFNRLCHSMSRKYRNITDCTSTLGFIKCGWLILKHVCVFISYLYNFAWYIHSSLIPFHLLNAKFIKWFDILVEI